MAMLGRLLGRKSKVRDVEVNDGVPVAGTPTVRPLTMSELVKQMIRREVSRDAQAEGYESFEEADDFEEEDPDVLPLTHHQVEAMNRHELQEEANGYGLELVDELPAKESVPAPAVRDRDSAGAGADGQEA